MTTDPPAPFLQETRRIPRGDAYSRVLRFAKSGVDFADAVLWVDIREKPSGPLLYDAAATAAITRTVGEMVAVITIPSATTETLPARCMLDVRVQVPALSFGPYTTARIHLRIEESYAGIPD